MSSEIEHIAQVLRDAAQAGVPCPPVRELVTDPGMSAAYAIQKHNVMEGVRRGRRVVGRKIGLTSKAVQSQLGVGEPDFGTLFADIAVPDGVGIPMSAVMQPRVEAEVALVLGRDLAGEGLTVADVLRAVDFALPAIEVVDSRIAAWNIGIFDTVADNASSGLFVLGNSPKSLRGLDLRLCGMRLDHGNETVSTGCGAACLGDPVVAALWLATRMSVEGDPLRAGDIILTGALGPMVDVVAGGVYEARISGLGSVRAVFDNAAG